MLTVFAVFSVTYLGEKLKWNYGVGAACLVLGVFFVFHKWRYYATISCGAHATISCNFEK
jgi:drug/metabolite transporter (DMT)-like permease